MKEDYKIGQRGLQIVQKVHEESPAKEKKGRDKKRGYKEGIYYGYITIIAVTAVGVIAMVGCLSYLSMGEEKYYTTDYQGEVRSLQPYFIKER